MGALGFSGVCASAAMLAPLHPHSADLPVVVIKLVSGGAAGCVAGVGLLDGMNRLHRTGISASIRRSALLPRCSSFGLRILL